MHEVTLGKAILRIVLDQVSSGSIKTVKVNIGQAHHLEKNSLEKAWQALTNGTPAEGAALDITQPPLVFSCYECQKRFTGQIGAEWRCPNCTSASLEMVGGREMEVVSFTKEEEDGNQCSNPNLGRK